MERFEQFISRWGRDRRVLGGLCLVLVGFYLFFGRHMSYEGWAHLAAGWASLATMASLIVGGYWVYRRYIIEEDRYPHIAFSADMNFIGIQGDVWIVELLAFIENKGKVRHSMSVFTFDLNALYEGEQVVTNARWGNQIDFTHAIAQGSFLGDSIASFFVDPGVTAKYSYVTPVSRRATFLILHCRFDYGDNREFHHSAERTLRVPKSDAL
jgi:hypothetical protein